LAQAAFEIDPLKISPDSDEAVNKLYLLLSTQQIFSAITFSVKDIPPGIRSLCKFIKKEVSEEFPEAEYKAIGAFIFLR
jgi:hypothetical protein